MSGEELKPAAWMYRGHLRDILEFERLPERYRAAYDSETPLGPVEELQAEIASLKQRLESAEGVIEDCHQLLQCVEQTSSNVWWVNADDPETAVCDTFGKVEEFLKDERMVTCHIALQEQEKQNG